MSIRNLGLVGGAAYALGGPLLIVGLAMDGVAWGSVAGVTAVWLGLGAVLAALAQLARQQHHLVRNVTERLADLDALDELAGLDARVDARIEARHRELLRVVDARLLGLHELVRDVAAPVDRDGPS